MHKCDRNNSVCLSNYNDSCTMYNYNHNNSTMSNNYNHNFGTMSNHNKY